jgi:glycerate dehydrogenase
MSPVTKSPGTVSNADQPMKIVALDTYTVDFDGLTWTGFDELGEFEKYPRTQPDELFSRASGAGALLVNKCVLDGEFLRAASALRYIGVTATGYNNVDVAVCREKGIALTNVPGYSTASVAQLVFAFLLDRCCRVASYDALVKSGQWSNAPDFALPQFGQRDLAGMKLGIVGYGAIGQAVARIARAFDMQVLIAALPGRPSGEGRLPLEQIFREADAVSLHCPLTPQTEGLIDEWAISLMKPDCLLINTARGKLLQESAVAKALKAGRLRCACLDVLSEEPPPTDNPLLSAPDTVITPHIAWATRQARERLLEEVRKNLQAFLGGSRRNRLDVEHSRESARRPG